MVLTSGNVPDSKDALAKFVLEVLSEVQKKEAYFLSRLNVKTIIYEQVGEVLIELDFGKLYRFMSQNGIARMEKKVFMGKEDKLPTRTVIELMPDQVYEQRVRKVKAYKPHER